MQQVVRRKHSSRLPPSPLFPTRIEHPESGMQIAMLWHADLRACCSHTSPPLPPTDLPKRSSPRGRKASASARHAATAAGRQTKGVLTQTSTTPLFHQARASKLWHAKCSAIACRFACLLCSHVTAAKTHRSTSALLTLGSRGFCVSASCGHASCSRSSDTRLPHAHLHHPSSLPVSTIQSLACKMSCYGMSICVPAFHTSPPLRPTAPTRGREASASARHAATHHAAGQAVRHIKGFLAQTSITPLPYHA